MNWLDHVIDRLSPELVPVSPEVTAGLLPLMNLIRRARGERQLTLAEELARPRGRVDPEELARLIDEARARVARDEAELIRGSV
ncbi:hypothetical protein [Amycolatopsis pithecellobii]|uniref:Uncharacterized protein n=1 Tax=Amycolatopsis pithecellobii TaxID=664692 RepID=A0A6N7YRP9_9PSEU|nr:hypothetical protein [Amycolatopsis pithecellobii]MTD55705.1 hypothetical protein [Amycolatopsis pithecellobii]